jgi:hypothetical protein
LFIQRPVVPAAFASGGIKHAACQSRRRSIVG